MATNYIATKHLPKQMISRQQTGETSSVFSKHWSEHGNGAATLLKLSLHLTLEK
jgi:hypothetical protein